MIAAKFAFRPILPTRLHLFCRISSFVQVRYQRAEVASSTSENIDDEPPEPLPFDQIPGPRGKYATAIQFYRRSNGFTKFHKLMQQLFEDYGPIYKEYVTEKTPVVHVIEPADYETVFRNEGKYPFRTPLDGMVKHRKRKGQSPGMANVSGKEWQRLRQAVAPKLMRPKVLEENIDNFNAVTKETIERLVKLKETSGLDGEIPDLEGELSKWATESVGTLVFDTRVGLYNDPPSEDAVRFIEGINDFFKYQHILLFGFVEKNLLPYIDTPSFTKLSKALDTIDEIGEMFVNKKIQELEEMSTRDNSQENQVVSLLTYLLAKKELTPFEVRDNAVTMFGAGVDTTAYTTLWLMYHLARNPTIQENLHQELYSILGKDGNVTAGSLAKLSYLKACGKESARMTPVAVGNRRVLEKDVVLSGYLVPAQTIIHLDFYSTGMSEKHFKDALEYKPERWLRENKKEIDPFAFLPFGFGPRMCIGSRVAELEMHLLVAKLIQRFRLEYHHEPLEMYQKITAVPEKPVKIKFVERY